MAPFIQKAAARKYKEQLDRTAKEKATALRTAKSLERKLVFFKAMLDATHTGTRWLTESQKQVVAARVGLRPQSVYDSAPRSQKIRG